MESSEQDAQMPLAAPDTTFPPARREGGEVSPRFEPQGRFVRSLSLSALLHLAAICGVFLVLLWFSMRVERDPDRKDTFLAALEEPFPETPEEEREDPPEVEEPELEEEPELVEQPPTFEQIMPPEPPEEEPLDWLPPEDPLDELDPELWVLPREPEPEPAPTVPPPPPEEIPDPDPPEEVVSDPQRVPVAVEKPKPRYPRKAAALGWEGTVRLRIQVDGDGNVIDVEVVESTGHDILDEAAVRAFRRWVFAKRAPGEPEVRSFVKSFVFKK